MGKKLLFRLTKKDFIVQPFIDSGKGGQKRNKTMSCCRIKHPESGAVSECTEQRSFFQNRSIAFKRLTEKPLFKQWHKIKVAKLLGNMIDEDKWADQQMDLKNLRIEVKDEKGRWMVVNDVENFEWDDLEE